MVERVAKMENAQENWPTGYPSIDKPWLKYYSEEAIHAPLPDGSMFEYMISCNAGRLDATALNYFGRKISYRKLIYMVSCAANAFSQIGIEQGTIVTAFALNTPECIASIYALNRLGAIVDLQYVNLTSRETAEYLQHMRTRFILTADMFLPMIQDALETDDSIQVIVAPTARSLPLLKRMLFPKQLRYGEAKNVLWLDDLGRWAKCQSTVPAGEGDAPALIIHTSGTTGLPKGVLLSSKNANAVAVEYKNSLLALKAGDSILNIAPPFVAFGICLAIHTPLCLGLQVCLSPSPDPEKAGELFAFYKPTHFLGGTAHIRKIIQVQRKKRQNLNFAKTIGYGGEAIPNTEAEQYASFFRNRGARISHLTPGYGMTEFGGTVVLAGSVVWKEESVGIPLPFANIKIVDTESGGELSYGRVGEIWMTSPSLMLGYYQNPEEDSKAIIADEDGVRWLKTGDLGEMDQDGFLFLRGRIKRIYLAKGNDNGIYKLFPDQIERVIQEYAPVSECAAVVISTDGIFYESVAFVVAQEGCVSQIHQYCIDHLPEYMVPKEIHIIDHIPSTVTGKADYHLLEDLVIKERAKKA